jgi:phosphatidylserine decarboxylase
VRPRRPAALALFVAGCLALLALFLLLRYAVVTDHLYHALVKDPERAIPSGNVIVAPADGTVLYVRRVRDGRIPELVKRGQAVPLVEHLKAGGERAFRDGYLIGIYMNTDGVHVNRVPIAGVVREQIVFNGPHLNMSETERTVLLARLIPGWVSLKKLLGWPPFDLQDEAGYVLASARETLRFEDERGTDVYVVRIADYTIGRILTWVREGQRVETGQRLGMITWGSQTDVYFEATPGLRARVEAGDHVYGGETVLATY